MPTAIPSYPDGNNATPVARRSVPAAPIASSSTWPVIHHGVTCDSCRNTIEGIRHNCLECPGQYLSYARGNQHLQLLDYDLCTICITSGGAERHNPFHEFLELSTPVDVYRESDREISERGGDAAAISSESITHQAICDLCDSQIRGDRYVSCFEYLACIWHCVCGRNVCIVLILIHARAALGNAYSLWFPRDSGIFSITEIQHPKHNFVRLERSEDYIVR